MPNGWSETFIELEGAKMHVTRTGDGSMPPLVLAHGLSDEGLCWQPTAEELQGSYDIILPDARAHGLSARVQPGQLVDRPADLAGVMRTLGVKEAVVGGHSMGAEMVARLAVRFPELVRALILEDPPWRLPRQDDSSPAAPGEKPVVNPVQIEVSELCALPYPALLARCHAEHPAWAEIVVQRWCEGKAHLDLNHFATRLADTTGWVQTVQEIACPVLLITSDPSLGGIVTPEVAQKARALNPRLRVANIPNVGHHIRFGNHPAFMQAVRGFLAELN